MAHVYVSTIAREAFHKSYEVVLVEDRIGDRDFPGVQGDELTRVALVELADVFDTVAKSSDIKRSLSIDRKKNDQSLIPPIRDHLRANASHHCHRVNVFDLAVNDSDLVTIWPSAQAIKLAENIYTSHDFVDYISSLTINLGTSSSG
jgi:hypothetical protein